MMAKSGHQKIHYMKLREWRAATNTDTEKSMCSYCDEDILKTGAKNCYHSCDTFNVWVDDATAEKIKPYLEFREAA